MPLAQTQRYPWLEGFPQPIASLLADGPSRQTDLRWDLEPGSDDGLALLAGDYLPVELADLIRHARLETGHDAGEKDSGHVAEGGLVMAARLAHQPLVPSSECRIDPARMLGYEVQSLPQARVARLVGPPVLSVSPNDRSRAQNRKTIGLRQAREPPDVPEPPTDLGGKDVPDARHRQQDAWGSASAYRSAIRPPAA